MGKTSIEWTDTTWNPVRGCSLVSEGCRNCYAMKQAHRFAGPGQPYEGLTEAGPQGPRWTGEVRLVPEHLADPLWWREPRRVFVNSMSDLFHEGLTNEQIAAVFGVMAAAPRHTFQVLTKRAERMRDWFKWLESAAQACRHVFPYDGHGWHRAHVLRGCALNHGTDMPPQDLDEVPWPLPNVWIGVSVEDQKRADERIPLLLETPAAVRFVSAEPLLGPVGLRRWLGRSCDGHIVGHWGDGEPEYARCNGCQPTIDWVIVGGESGHGARPFDVAWARRIVSDCVESGGRCFVKQLGASPNYLGTPIPLRSRKGNDPAEWPPGLNFREFPEVRPC